MLHLGCLSKTLPDVISLMSLTVVEIMINNYQELSFNEL